MLQGDSDVPLDPQVYAPFASPEDYILEWTDLIWEDFGLARLDEHYAADVIVRGAYGTIHGRSTVLGGSLMKKSAFPNRVITAEDVICEERGDNAFVSHHRALNAGPQDGWWVYGPPQHRQSVSRNIAVCLVRDGLVAEEWVVRDEYSVVVGLGLDPQAVARTLAFTGDLFTGARPADPVLAGDAGPRPPEHREAAHVVVDLIEQVWNRRHLEQVPQRTIRDVITQTTRGRTITRPRGYQIELTQMLAPFPDATIEVRDVAVAEDPGRGLRVGVLWRMAGRYCGVPVHGPTTDSPVEVMGASQFLLRDMKVVNEWRVYDEIAVLAQIARARGDEPS